MILRTSSPRSGSRWLRARGLAVAALLAWGCRHATVPAGPQVDPAAAAAVAWSRPTVNPVRARFQIRLDAPKLGLKGTTGGALIAARPGQGRLDVLSPLGQPMVTLATDGTAFDALIARSRQHYTSASAETVLREVTSGVAGIDDVLAVLTGALPFPEAEVTSVVPATPERGTVLTFLGPSGAHIEAELDPVALTPRQVIARDTAGNILLQATYVFEPVESPQEPAADGTPVPVLWMPKTVEASMPSMELTVELTMRSWTPLDEVPDAFSPEVPETYETAPLEDAVKRLIESTRAP